MDLSLLNLFCSFFYVIFLISVGLKFDCFLHLFFTLPLFIIIENPPNFNMTKNYTEKREIQQNLMPILFDLKENFPKH